MRNFHPFFVIIFLLPVFVAAQTDTTKKSSNKINVFDRNDDSSPFTNLDKGKTQNINVIKLNPFLILRGELPVYYERQLGKSSSVEIGVGPTFRNYMLDVTNALDSDIIKTPFFVSDAIWKTGITFKVAFKYFPGDDFMDGVYFSPELAYRFNGIQYPINDSSGATGAYYAGSYRTIEFKLLFGYESDIFDSKNVIGEFYIGAGIRSFNVNYYTNNESTGYNYATGMPYNFVPNKAVNYTGIKPAFYFGYRFGFMFK